MIRTSSWYRLFFVVALTVVGQLGCGSDGSDVTDTPNGGADATADGDSASTSDDGATGNGDGSSSGDGSTGNDGGRDGSSDGSSDGNTVDTGPVDSGLGEAGAACTGDAQCDDGQLCNGNEFCALGFCRAGTPPSCTDNISCTTDFCDSVANVCKHSKSDTACSDGLFCNGPEVCDPVNGAALTGCLAGVAPNCNDSIACTTDACSNTTGACEHTPQNSACDDGAYCNGQEICDVALGCKAGPAIDCNDGKSCTVDSCSNALSACQHAPDNSVCNDNLFCNGVETCSVTGAGPSGCVDGTPVACPTDGIACTVDACSETTQGCTYTPTNTLCSNGQFCVATAGGCQAGAPCQNAGQCQDGNLCNGVEACVNGACAPGTAVSCNDSVSCTADSCDPGTGACAHVPNDLACGDGLACNGIETCNPTSGCAAGVDVNCNDGVSCTSDTCSEPTGTCTHVTNNYMCDDGQVCNGAEVCNAGSGCQAGPAYTCPTTGVSCTTNVCDPVLNGCKPITNNAACPCGQVCDATLGCGNFCTVKTCQGKVYECGDCQDNDNDCRIDSDDSQCLGPCDNTENSYYGGISGQNNAPCKADCYFDADTGAGNDDCYWSHKCDPYEVAPNYPPEGNKCTYDQAASIPGTSQTCSQLSATQSSTCASYCGPLTPNGCDCVGCCDIPGAPTTVYLGSENPAGTGSCNIATVADPLNCKPCTVVPACYNTCGHCELCVGKTTLPADCISQTCPAGAQVCGLAGQSPCPANQSCITGCCFANPG